MKLYRIDYKKAGGPTRPGIRAHRGWWLADVPRLLLRCTLLGHRPVVAGSSSHPDGDHPDNGQPERWVRCGRCGEAPLPRGRLNAALWPAGAPYTGPWMPPPVSGVRDPDRLLDAVSDLPYYPPGEFPAPVGDFHLEAVTGRCVPPGAAFTVTVGGTGSDEAASLTVRAHRLALLHLAATAHGRVLQRLLNPTDEERNISLYVESGRLRWDCWLPRPVERAAWWQSWSLPLNPVDAVLESRSRPLGTGTMTLVLPGGGGIYTLPLTLRRYRQRRLGGARPGAWLVTWEHRPGIPTRPDGSAPLRSSSVTVSGDAVRNGTWVQEAGTAILQSFKLLHAEDPAPAPAPQ